METQNLEMIDIFDDLSDLEIHESCPTFDTLLFFTEEKTCTKSEDNRLNNFGKNAQKQQVWK